MGYSAYVICRNLAARDAMHKFLQENVTPWQRLEKPKETFTDLHYTQYPVVGDDIAYGAKPLALGYNFSTQGEASVYLWALLRFAAQRVGRYKTIKGVKTKFTVYDGHEFFPVGDCDENGFAPERKPWLLSLLAGEIKVQKRVKAEMARLGKLWELR